MKFFTKINRIKNPLLFLAIIIFFTPSDLYSQKNMWMSAGSLHNWYSEMGSEIEEGGFVRTQQDGMQWPAIMPYQDMQAARGMWIGARNFTDENGTNFPYKVVTVGPRPPAFYAVYPTEFKMISKFEPTIVSVDGLPSFQKNVEIDELDETMIWDRMIENVVNTQLGLTMTRRIFQFSQQFHDNYIVYEYIFTNTGNTDADTTIELSNTLEDVYFFWTYRNSVNKQTRFIIGNSTGWGKNTMNDARGDGVEVDPPGEQFRAQFSWHGYTTEKDVTYDNIGGPIFAISTTARTWFPDRSDTTGRLGATQFLGTLTVHADKSYNDNTDDVTQPSTTSWVNSDYGLFLGGRDNAFNVPRMTEQYQYMISGHQSPRHARFIEPSGDYALQRTPPHNDGTPAGASGGISFNNGYGPYTIPFGESIRLVVIEAANGMNRDEQVRIGRLFKQGTMSDVDKNREVMKSKDSLFLTFRRAIENFQSGWNIPQPPFPPVAFDVNGGGDRITLSWTPRPNDPNPPGEYHIYRAEKNLDSTYRLIHIASAGDNSYDDLTPIRGVDYYYYLVAVGPNQAGGPGTPAGKLESGRYYTQTYDPVRLKRPAGKSLSDIRIVPNPFSISGADNLRFPGDRIAFYNIPGQCTIRIYSELGELIKTIEHTDGSGDEFWDSVTSSNQIVVSGIYIAVITDNTTGEKHIAKFAVVR